MQLISRFKTLHLLTLTQEGEYFNMMLSDTGKLELFTELQLRRSPIHQATPFPGI
jgi:hypothetical protein